MRVLLLLLLAFGAQAQIGAYRYVEAAPTLRLALMERGWVLADAGGAQLYPCQVLHWSGGVGRDCRGEVVYRGTELPWCEFQDSAYEAKYVPGVGHSKDPVVERYRTFGGSQVYELGLTSAGDLVVIETNVNYWHAGEVKAVLQNISGSLYAYTEWDAMKARHQGVVDMDGAVSIGELNLIKVR